MLSKSVLKSRPTVLWRYKDKLDLSSYKKKSSKQVKKLMQRGLLDPEKDFEAPTPNLLARTIETVGAGGLILLLLRSLSSLTSPYNMVMDVHGRFRTESYSEAAGSFNE